MSETRKTPWTIWVTTILILALVIYPLSLGPTVALFTSAVGESLIEALGPTGKQTIGLAVEITYWPLERLSVAFPDTIGSALERYIEWWAQDDSLVSPSVPASAPLPAPPLPGPPMIDSL